jgi:hypothetical protein
LKVCSSSAPVLVAGPPEVYVTTGQSRPSGPQARISAGDFSKSVMGW